MTMANAKHDALITTLRDFPEARALSCRALADEVLRRTRVEVSHNFCHRYRSEYDGDPDVKLSTDEGPITMTVSADGRLYPARTPDRWKKNPKCPACRRRVRRALDEEIAAYRMREKRKLFKRLAQLYARGIASLLPAELMTHIHFDGHVEVQVRGHDGVLREVVIAPLAEFEPHLRELADMLEEIEEDETVADVWTRFDDRWIEGVRNGEITCG